MFTKPRMAASNGSAVKVLVSLVRVCVLMLAAPALSHGGLPLYLAMHCRCSA